MSTSLWYLQSNHQTLLPPSPRHATLFQENQNTLQRYLSVKDRPTASIKGIATARSIDTTYLYHNTLKKMKLSSLSVVVLLFEYSMEAYKNTIRFDNNCWGDEDLIWYFHSFYLSIQDWHIKSEISSVMKLWRNFLSVNPACDF